MTWDAVDKFDFLVEMKNLTMKMALAICRKLDLGQPVDGYLDMFYLICNLVFVIDEGSVNYTDANYDYIYGLYVKVLKYHNRYKGL
jgi:hypothetical protein